MKLRLLGVVTILMLGLSVNVMGQSHKAKKLYKYYEAQPNTKIKEIPKSLINLGMAFVKTDASVKTIVNDLELLKVMSIQTPQNMSELENRLPGKKYNFKMDGSNKNMTIWVKRCLFKVKEVHLLTETNRKTMVVSAYGKFKIKDLKKVNEDFIQKGGLKNLPF